MEGLTLADICCSHHTNPIPKGIAEEEGWIGEERSISDRYSNTIRLVDTLNRWEDWEDWAARLSEGSSFWGHT